MARGLVADITDITDMSDMSECHGGRVEDKFHGKGKMTYADGSEYDGDVSW